MSTAPSPQQSEASFSLQQSPDQQQQQQNQDQSPDGTASKPKTKKIVKKVRKSTKETAGGGGDGEQQQENPADASMMNQSTNNNNNMSPEASMNASASPGKVKHGRRALREGEYSNVPVARKGWGDAAGGGADDSNNTQQQLTGDQQQVATFREGDIDAATQKAIDKNNADALAAHEQLVGEVAQAATEFHSAMPKQSDLERETAAKFQSLLSQASQEGVDLQCLMSTLTGQFDDEDVTWDPETLLMNLTSEINDRLGGGEDEEFDVNFSHGYGYHDGSGVQQQQQQQQGGGGNAGGTQQQQQPTASVSTQGRDRSSAFGLPAPTSTTSPQLDVSHSHHNNNQPEVSPAVHHGATNDEQNAPAHGRRRRG